MIRRFLIRFGSRPILARIAEIFGMTLILGAWFLEWGLVGKWQKIESGVSETSLIPEQLLTPVYLSSELHFQVALLRATSQCANKRPASLYLLGDTWFDPDVRRGWLERFETNIAKNDAVIMGLFLERYALGLKHVTMADSLKREIQDLWRDVAKGVDVEQREGRLVKTPNVDRMQSADAIAYDSRLAVIANKLSLANLQIMSPIQDKANRSSRLHRAIFLIGSLFLITGRVVEPISCRQTSNASKSACS